MLEAAICSNDPFSAHLTIGHALFDKNGSGEGSVSNHPQTQSFSSSAQRAMKSKLSFSFPEEGEKEKKTSIYGCQLKGQLK